MPSLPGQEPACPGRYQGSDVLGHLRGGALCLVIGRQTRLSRQVRRRLVRAAGRGSAAGGL